MCLVLFFDCIVGILISLLTVAACADKRRRRPLFIVQGLMCGDSLSSFWFVVSVLGRWMRAFAWYSPVLSWFSLWASRTCRVCAFSSWWVLIGSLWQEWSGDQDTRRIPHLSRAVPVSLLWGMSPRGRSEFCWLCYVSVVGIVALCCVPQWGATSLLGVGCLLTRANRLDRKLSRPVF